MLAQDVPALAYPCPARTTPWRRTHSLYRPFIAQLRDGPEDCTGSELADFTEHSKGLEERAHQSCLARPR